MTIASSLSAPRLLVDVLPGRVARDVAVVVGSAAFVGASAQVLVPLPFTPVPLSLQTLAVLLVGAAAGPSRSLVAMLLYIVVGTLGMPWFAGGDSGWGGASFGYVLGFAIAAPLVGALAARGADRTVLRTTALMIVGNVAIYLCGVTWLTVSTGMALPKALLLGVVPFLVGDLLKIAVAATVLPGAWRLVGPHGSRADVAAKPTAT